MDVEDEHPQFQCWFSDKLYTSHYLMHGGLHRMRTLETEVQQRTAVGNSLFVGWPPLELFAVLPKGHHRYYVQVPPLWRELEPHCMHTVLTPPMFAYCSGAFGNGERLSTRLLCKAETTEFTEIPFVCFIRAVEIGVSDSLLPSRFRALGDEGRLCANKGALILLSRKMKATVLDCGCQRFLIFVKLIQWPHWCSFFERLRSDGWIWKR